MSVKTQINRLSNAKNAIADAIENKGVSVPSTTKLDGMATLINAISTSSGGMTLLWTNASPTSSFAAQTVSLSLSSYTMVAVLFAYANSINTMQHVFMLPVNGATTVCSFYWTAEKTLRAIRNAKASTSGVAFEGGYTDNGGITANNIYAVPLKIYGIK